MTLGVVLRLDWIEEKLWVETALGDLVYVCKAVDESLAPACAHGKDGLSQYISEVHPVGFDEQ